MNVTAREREVWVGLALGFSNKELAARLGISYYTVKNHVARLYLKLGVNDRVALTLLAGSVGVLTEAARDKRLAELWAHSPEGEY